jgi:hypothetical protein
MKTHVCCFWYLALSMFVVGTVLATDVNSTVTIYPTDPQAAEAWSDPGTFTVRRVGGTNFSQLIFYELSGTASNGVDYEQIPGTIEMPVGVTAVSFTVRPINDSLVEGTETVVARIMPSPLDCATCGYDIGQPDVAEVFIKDNDTGGTNHPPFVRLNVPQDGEVFIAPAEIALRAYAQDTEDGFSVKVEFLEGTNSLGSGVFVPSMCPAPYCPYFTLMWSNVPPGQYTLTARATDSAGIISTSSPARVIVYHPDRARSGLYRIESGTFSACCGIGGNDLGYDLPNDAQTFIHLEINPQGTSASMSFLGADARTVFSVVPCPPSPVIPFSFDHGLVFSNRIVFHVDPAIWYWNYTVSNSADTLRIDGEVGVMQRSCVDTPDRYRHSNVVATLVASAPRIETVERQGNLLRFNFTGEPPYIYYVEHTEALPAQSWVTLTNFVAKIGTIQALVTDPMTNRARFYRIRKEPCFCRTP